MKTNQFPTRLEKRRDRGDLRKEMFNRKKGEEELSKGMAIRKIFLRAQGFNVKEDEDKSEKYEFDAKVIAVLEEEVRIEVVSKQVDKFSKMWYSRNDPATRRAKAMMQKIMGKKYQPIVQREEKLCFQHTPRQNSAVSASKDRASARAKAIMRNSLVQKS
jgi:hypothetical protein